MSEAKWLHVAIDMFHADVLVCIGTRMQMLGSGAEYLRENTKWSAEKIDRIGKDIASKIPCENDSRICGEVLYANAGGGLLYIIRLDSFVPSSEHIAVLGHECVHVALGMSRDLRIEEEGGHECLCYLWEHVFRNALEMLTADCVQRVDREKDVR